MAGKGVLLACCLLGALSGQDSGPASRPATEYVTGDGLRVRIVPVAETPGEVALILGIHGAGILAEPKDLPHLAHLSEHAICHGSGSDARTAFIEELVAAGRANAETLPDFMYFDVYASPETLGTAIELQMERLRRDHVQASILAREKPRALAEVTHLEGASTDRTDRLGKFAWCAFTQAARHGVASTPLRARTDALTLEDVRAFRAATFSPRSAMLTVVGDVDPDAVRKVVPPDPGEKPPPRVPSPTIVKPEKRRATWDVRSHQTFIAWPAPAPGDAAHPALAVAAQALQSKLVMTPAIVKATKQSPMASADAMGLFVVQLPLRDPESGEAVARSVQDVVDALAAGDASLRAPRFFKRAVRVNAGIGPFSYPPQLPRKILAPANQELWYLRATLTWGQPPEEYCARVDAVTADDVRTAIKSHLAADRATIVTLAGVQ
jgi:predicted Zn-dependent peptidase